MNKHINLNVTLKTQEDIDKAAYNFVQLLKNSAHNAATQSNTNKRTTIYKLPLLIKCLIVDKRRARATWQHTRYYSDKRVFNHLANKFKKELQKYKSEQYVNYIRSLNPMDNALWRATKRLTNTKETIPPLIKDDGTLAISDDEKALLFAEYLSNTFKPHQDIIPDISQVNMVNDFLSSPLPMSMPVKPFSPGEVQATIKKLPKGKAPGNDLITNKLLMNLYRKCILLLTFIYNAILRLSYLENSRSYCHT